MATSVLEQIRRRREEAGSTTGGTDGGGTSVLEQIRRRRESQQAPSHQGDFARAGNISEAEFPETDTGQYDLSILTEPMRYTPLGASYSLLARSNPGVAGAISDYLLKPGLGLAGSAAYWVDRPYAAHMAFWDGAMDGVSQFTKGEMGALRAAANPWVQAGSAFIGNREGSMLHLLENAGMDPNSTGTIALGAGLDVVGGVLLDPLNYATFGLAAPLESLTTPGKLSKFLTSFDDVLDAGSDFRKALEARGGLPSSALMRRLQEAKDADEAGLILKSRVAAAKHGLWGLNIKMPYVPVISKRVNPQVEALANSMGYGDLFKRLTREGITITPRGANMMAARTIDGVGEWLTPAHRLIRKAVGGRRFNEQVAGTEELSETLHDISKRNSIRAMERAEETRKVAETVPKDVRRQMSAIQENPELLDEAQRVSVLRPVPDEEQEVIRKLNAEVLQTNEEAVRAVNAHARLEFGAIRNTLDDFNKSADRIMVVTADDLAQYTGRTTEELLDELMDAGADRIEELINGYARDIEALPEFAPGQEGRVRFKAVADENLYYKTRHLSGRKQAKVLEKANEARAEARGLRMPYEGAADLGETSNPRFLVELPEGFNLTDEFGPLPNRTDTGLGRKQRKLIDSTVEGFDRYVQSGGDWEKVMRALRDSENKDLPAAARKAARATYLGELKRMYRNVPGQRDPMPIKDNATTRNIIKAVEARTMANTNVPGEYTRASSRIADDMLAHELFSDDPVARFWYTHESLRHAADDVLQKLSHLDRGILPDMDAVKLDELLPEELDEMRDALSLRDTIVQRRDGVLRNLEQLDELAERTGRYDFDSPERAQLQSELHMLNRQIWDNTGSPIKEFTRRYREELLEELDGIRYQLEHPNRMERALYIRGYYTNKLQKIKTMRKELVEVDQIDISGWTDEQVAAFHRYQGMKREMETDMLARIKRYDSDAELPIDNYVHHMSARTRLGEWMTEKARRKEWEAARLSELADANPDKQFTVLKEQARKEARDKFKGSGFLRMTADELKRGAGQFKRRKHEGTIEAQNLMGRGLESDAFKILDVEWSNHSRWVANVEMAEAAIESGAARKFASMEEARKALGDDAVRLDIDGLMPFVAPDKNPFTNLYATKEAAQVMKRYMSGVAPSGMTDEVTGMVTRFFDTIRQWGSAHMLIWRMQYHSRNLVSDVDRLRMEGGNIDLSNPEVMERLKASWRLVMPESVSGPREDALKPFLERMRKMFPHHAKGLLDDQKFQEYLYAHVLDAPMREGMEGLEGKFVSDMQMPKFWRSLHEFLVEQTVDSAKGVARAASHLVHPNPAKNRAMKFVSRWVGEPTQNITRAWLFLDRLDYHAANGLVDLPDAMAAARGSVRRALFDYRDLTSFEQNVLKNFNWFYTFMAKSIPFHLRKAVTNPGSFGPWYRAYQGFWNGYAPELQPSDLPAWLQETGGMPIAEYTDDEGRKEYAAVTPVGWIGMGDLIELADWTRAIFSLGPGGEPIDHEGITRFLGQNLTNPATKNFIEGFLKRDLRTGREIDENERMDWYGLPVPRQLMNLFRTLTFFNDLDTLDPGGVWTKIAEKSGAIEPGAQRAHRNVPPEGARWFRFITGLRTYDAVPERDFYFKIRDLEKEIEGINRNIWSSESSGNKAELEHNERLLVEKEAEMDALVARQSHYEKERLDFQMDKFLETRRSR